MASHDEISSTVLASLLMRAAAIWTRDACGVTRSETAIPALVHADAYVPTTPCKRVLLIGGLSGHPDDVSLAFKALNAYLDAGERYTQNIVLSAIPLGNPDGLTSETAPENGVGGCPSLGYPPTDRFFDDAYNPESRYLWRWIGLQAPDVVVEIRAGQTVAWEASAAAATLVPALQATALTPADGLLAALGTGNPNGLGPLPGLRVTTSPEALPAQLERLCTLLQQTPHVSPFPARRSLDARRTRTPLEIARLLAGVYGYTLDPVVYTQGMSISPKFPWQNRQRVK